MNFIPSLPGRVFSDVGICFPQINLWAESIPSLWDVLGQLCFLPSRSDEAPIAHIFKYGKNGNPNTKIFVPKGQLNDIFVGRQNNGCNAFHPVPFGTGGWVGGCHCFPQMNSWVIGMSSLAGRPSEWNAHGNNHPS